MSRDERAYILAGCILWTAALGSVAALVGVVIVAVHFLVKFW